MVTAPGRTGERFAVGVDFGTLSARAVVVRVADGEEFGSGVADYRHGVIAEALPASRRRLAPDWALQDPGDWWLALRDAVRAAIAAGGVAPESVIGIGTDFTACTVLPVRADGTPLCQVPGLDDEPHAWPKLWKHHAAQPQADRINDLAHARGEGWIGRYGGRISSEWEFAKALQVLEESPHVYQATRPVDRGRRLDRLAAMRRRDPQRLHRRVQGHLPGRPVSLGRLSGRAEPGVRRLRRNPAVRRGIGAARVPGRWPDREGGGVDRPAGGHSGGGRKRRRPCHRSGRREHRARPDARHHGHVDLPRDEQPTYWPTYQACAASSTAASPPARTGTKPARAPSATSSPGGSGRVCRMVTTTRPRVVG